MSEFSGFPRNLAYSVKSLSGFSKTTVKLTPDKFTAVPANDTIRVKLPSNSLIDLRTLSMFFDVTTTSTAGKCHFPRLSSSIIEQLTLYVNGTMIENIQNYNVVYNTLFDLDGGGLDQQSKRFLENIDPSVSYTLNAATGATAIVKNTLQATANDNNKPLMINSWIGAISSSTTPIWDTNDCGDIILEIRLAPASILWQAGATACTGANYTISNVRFTMSKIVFNSPDYYNMKAAKLLGDGLLIGYQTYTSIKGSQVDKAASLSYTVNINTSSLDQVIATVIDGNANVMTPLLLGGAGVDATAATFNEKYVTPVDDVVSVATSGDLFNNSIYFKKNAVALSASSFEINNVMMNPSPLRPEEIYNETLIALGNLNIDMSAGVAPGCSSLNHFLKYYFAHILSLENISTGDFFKSGLDGRASSLSINWKFDFTGHGASQKVSPLIVCKTTRLLQINEAHQVSVIV
jgi:hypothetical protein